MVLRLKTRKSRSLPGLRNTESNPSLQFQFKNPPLQKCTAGFFVGWIPREHLLVMPSHHDRDVLRSELE
jgi:hypothetical protein